MIVYTKEGLIRVEADESSDSEVLFQISNEEYASAKFELNSWIPFDTGDYVNLFNNRYTLLDKPAPIVVNGTNKYSYTLKFESPRAFLDKVNFELFDDTSLLVINSYDAKTIYCKGSVVLASTNLVWRFIYDTPTVGSALTEGAYWTQVPSYSSGSYVKGNYVHILNVVYLCLKNTSIAPVEGEFWTVVNTAPAFDFTSILTPRGYAELLVSNMNRARPNQTWVVGSCIASNPLSQAFSNVTCLGALTSVCNLFQTEHWIDMDGDNFRININKLAYIAPKIIQDPQVLNYTNTDTLILEQGNGLTSITKQEVSGTSKITRLVALGSTSNLYGTYRNGSNRLMLPNRYYLDSLNIDTQNPLEGVVTLDDIKPELHHATEDYNPSTAYNAGSQVLDSSGRSFDCIAPCMGIAPLVGSNWKLSEGTITTFVSQYKFIDANLTFNPLDPKYIMSDGTIPKVSFLTGNMAGYQFPITNALSLGVNLGYEITIGQIQDSTDSVLPSAVYGMNQFDQYVLLDLYMPQSYVQKAESRLLDKATEYLAQYSLDQNQYDCPIDEVWATNNSIGFIKGQIVHIHNEKLGLDVDYRIITLKRNITSPYKQNITISQLPYVQSSYQALKNDVTNNSTYLEQSGVTSPMFKTRTFRGAQEAIDMAFNPDGDFYTEKIQPLTVQTASLLAGTATQQFTVAGIKFSSVPKTPNYIAWTAGSITDTKMQVASRTWSVAGGNSLTAPWGPITDSTIAYYCYLRCPVNTALTSGDIIFSQTQYKTVGTDGYYYFLVGTLGVVVDNMRQFYTSYGFTFINGNTITTGKIQGNGASFNLDTGEIKGNISFMAGDTYTDVGTGIAAAQAAAESEAVRLAGLAQIAAINAAAEDATAKANAAHDLAVSASETAAQAKADLAETNAKAHADGIVTAEEQRAIDDATTKANNAQAAAIAAAAEDATAKANAASAFAYANAQTYVNTIKSDLQSQIDGNITSFFYDYEPTLDNVPASNWSPDTVRDLHLGDLFYWTSKGYAYRYQKVGVIYSWTLIKDSDVTKALSDAATAQTIANGKRTTFSVQPFTPYLVADLWLNNGDLFSCNTARSSGAFVSSDWSKGVKYTDDTAVNNLQIGGRNLVLGSAIFFGWSGSGFNVIGNEISSVFNGVDNYLSSSATPIASGQIYTASFSAKIVGVNNTTIGFLLNGQRQDKTITNTYLRYSITVTANSSTGTIIFGTNAQNVAGTTLYIKDIKLELGSKATDWTPAPEDVQSQIDASNALLSDIANDNKLTPSEKQSTLKEWQLIMNEYSTNLAQAVYVGIDDGYDEYNDYVNAYSLLSAYITPLLLSLTTTSDIVGTTFRNNFNSYYLQKVKLLNSISTTINSNAITGVNIATETKNKVIGKNLIVSSLINQDSNSYGFAVRSVNLIGGQKYCLSANGNSANALNGKVLWVILYNPDWSFQQLLTFNSATTLTEFLVFIAPSTGTFSITSYYADSNDPRTGSVHLNWYKLEVGSYPTEWLEAPEDTQAKIDALAYLKAAYTGSTEITGGVVAANITLLKTLAGIITGGFSGLANDNMGFWTGGTYAEAIAGIAKTLLRKDGSGSLATGAISWSADGAGQLGNNSITWDSLRRLIINMTNFSIDIDGNVSVFGNLIQKSISFLISSLSISLSVTNYSYIIQRVYGYHASNASLYLSFPTGLINGTRFSMYINNRIVTSPTNVDVTSLLMISSNFNLIYKGDSGSGAQGSVIIPARSMAVLEGFYVSDSLGSGTNTPAFIIGTRTIMTF